MTIADEIQRINKNIQNAYSTCETKGATLPITQNTENLSSCIDSIPEGGSAKKYNITIDNILGEVDSSGNILDVPAGDLIATGVKKVDNYLLSCKFGGNAWGTTRKQGLSSVLFPDLTYIGNAGLAYFYTYATDLETVSFPELEEIGQCGLYCGFQWNTKLKKALFPKLKTTSGLYNALYNAFYYCQSLEEVDLHSLTSLNSGAMAGTFRNCTKLKTLSFDSLTKDSFNGYTNIFNGMLTNVSGCTVHFPYETEEVLSSWSDVLAGFGGSGTIILFDLKRATIEFTLSSDADIYLRGTKLDGTTGYAPPGSAQYMVYSSALNTLLSDTVSDLVADETTNVSVDLTQTSNKITIHTGISGLEVKFILNDCTFDAVEESNGNYSINIIGDIGTILNYSVNGGDNYSDVDGTITITGSSISQNVSLSTASVSTFTRPTLTANGTVGGDSFAVYSTNTVSGYYTYAVADSSTTNYVWLVNNYGTSSDLCFYNPKPLKVSALGITTTSTTYSPTQIDVYGSNDGSNWTLISTHSMSRSTTNNISPNSTKFYKYHKLTLTWTSLRIKELTITATQKG